MGIENAPGAIQQFQIQYGLSPDGKIGPKTLYKLNESVLNLLRRQSGQKWAEYKIRAYAFNVDEPLMLKATDLMQRNGISMYSIPLLSQRPSWLAQESTIFYYTEESRGKAEEIALVLEKELSMEFDVKLGSGLGVQPGEKTITFFVHIINSN
ncbi:MAG: peptidoglycan-binding protein [Desulfobacterium sp.]|nr:peptidoglycan-binding protein [Desulfobacterium sp.]